MLDNRVPLENFTSGRNHERALLHFSMTTTPARLAQRV